ncbi:hypothetical protein AB205_0116090 [Aquarana catesbeiana]|uniref:Uncharacterized protein n=1 Tax=Aquarana catesbeiana TaxID=8400 RepID=A0A2G9Q8H6_AQUCT|nr:hypothetical protein AB205_0116090 [Aquarana catesbeiana]
MCATFRDFIICHVTNFNSPLRMLIYKTNRFWLVLASKHVCLYFGLLSDRLVYTRSENLTTDICPRKILKPAIQHLSAENPTTIVRWSIQMVGFSANSLSSHNSHRKIQSCVRGFSDSSSLTLYIHDFLHKSALQMLKPAAEKKNNKQMYKKNQVSDKCQKL